MSSNKHCLQERKVGLTTPNLVSTSLNGKERLLSESEISFSHPSLNRNRTTTDFSTPRLSNNLTTIVFLTLKREVLLQVQYSQRNGSQ